jgi:cytochrome c553
MAQGRRRSAEPLKANAKTMYGFAKAMTEDEINAAADYFSAIPWTPWIKVVETDAAPKVRSDGGLYLPLTGAKAGTEPLGNRIIEVPVNPEHTDVLRDSRSPFIAYAPIGSVAKGRDIVTTGKGGQFAPCASCHGADLNGAGSIPGIAARSPSYICRQLNDIKQGTRAGEMAGLMKPVVAKLSADDMTNVCAYLASRPAPAAWPPLPSVRHKQDF